MANGLQCKYFRDGKKLLINKTFSRQLKIITKKIVVVKNHCCYIYLDGNGIFLDYHETILMMLFNYH